jgi:NTP pyrophosphatase (non-canonical NTP hydrolase)
MKPLQAWYREINGIYGDRNFYRSIESVFAHLVEVSRGLSLAATSRRKRHIIAEEFLPKTLAWWLALCGRAGVPDVEAMIWAKYPGVCPYCERPQHLAKFCKDSDDAHAHIRWRDLARTAEANVGARPQTLGGWQRMFNDIYPRASDTDHETNVARLTEEIGELAEAVRALPVAPQYFMAEAPDVFAWLMGFANQFDYDRREDLAGYGTRLSQALQAEYPGYCRLCEKAVCKCAPIPSATLGRIAKEIPADVVAGRLFSLQESIQLFRRGEAAVKVGDKVIAATREEVRLLAADTAAILSLLQQQSRWAPELMVRMSAALGRIKQVAEQGEVTQTGVNEILLILQQMPTENRQALVGFLNNMASSGTFAALVAAAQALPG